MQPVNLAIAAQLDVLTLAIGHESFGASLFKTANVTSGADHVMVFAFSPRQAPRVVISAGLIDSEIATRVSALYAGSLYLLDPHYAEVRRHKDMSAIWFDFDSSANCCDHFRETLIEGCGLSDLLSLAIAHEEIVYYFMFMRTGGNVFGDGQRWLIGQVGEMIAANVHKHFSYTHAIRGQNQFLIDRVLAESPVFRALTPRERLVSVGILTGHTSESIAMNLSISINSVLTYRKRLYEKLGISSQNELFVRVIAAMTELSSDGLDVGSPASASLRRTNGSDPSARFNEYYMAEAFLE